MCRRELERRLVSVETSWNRQATRSPTEGHPNPRMGQVPPVSESPGDIIKHAGYWVPPRNLNLSSRGVAEHPHS